MEPQDKCDDMLQLSDLSEASVVSCLLKRFEIEKIYTWLGENILISLNPNRELPNLYSEQQRQIIAKLFLTHKTPHVYSLAEQCLRRLRNANENQSIIISGLSGSGKTESAKHILHYLVYRNHERRCQEKLINASRIEKTLLKCNIILESFGNAQTICNKNSSRFGKYMCLHFDEKQFLVGSSLQIYLLEKPRSLFDATTLMTSFHIFRLFLSSLKESDLIDLGLNSLEEDYIQNFSSYSEDVSTWKELLDSLSYLDFPNDYIKQLRLLLAAIILLNSVRFLPAHSSRVEVPTNHRVRLLHQSNLDTRDARKNTSVVDSTGAAAIIHPDDVEKVIRAGCLLGLPPGEVAAEFIRQLTTRRVQAGSGVSWSRRLTEYVTTCTVSQAREQRDCLVKALYHSLFEYLVEKINDHLNPESAGIGQQELGILDLFGFEILSENGFEQFCINYANERLHETFMRIAVRSIETDLISEGLTSENSALSPHTCDNGLLLNALKVCSDLLDEVCLLNRVYEHATLLSNASDRLDPREVDWLRQMQAHCSGSKFVTLGLGQLSTPSKVQRSFSAKHCGPKNSDNSHTSRHSAESFTVKHYAGSVTYNVSGFVVKNLDRLPVHLINWLTDAALYRPNETSCAGSDGPVANEAPSIVHGSIFIRTVLTRAANSAVPVQSGGSSPMVCRSPLQQLNTPARLLTPTNSSSEKHSSQKAQLQRSFSRDITPSPPLVGSRRVNTVFGNFKSSLRCLLERLSTHQTSFVRCLRPMPSTASGTYSLTRLREPIVPNCVTSLHVDKEHVKSQLLTSGLFDALCVLHKAYPARYTYMEFTRKYRVLRLLHSSPSSDTLNNTHFAALTDWHSRLFGQPQVSSKRITQTQRHDTDESETLQQQRIVLLLLILGLNLIPADQDPIGRESADQPEWLALIRQFGRTRIHLTSSQMGRLDTLRNLMRNRAAKRIQTFFRRYCIYTRASRLIQRWWRHCHSRFNERSLSEQAPTLFLDSSPKTTIETNVDENNLGRSTETPYPENSLLFATDEPHIVSCRILFDRSRMTDYCPPRYWCSDRLNRLNCLIPFVHLAKARQFNHSVRGLVDALSRPL